MIRYECDKCGTRMNSNDPERFIVRLEIYAAASHLDLDADAGSGSRESLTQLVKSLAKADPDKIEDQTYRLLKFDVCDTCRQTLLERPLA